jgi:hypothetical protein
VGDRNIGMMEEWNVGSGRSPLLSASLTLQSFNPSFHHSIS